MPFGVAPAWGATSGRLGHWWGYLVTNPSLRGVLGSVEGHCVADRSAERPRLGRFVEDQLAPTLSAWIQDPSSQIVLAHSNAREVCFFMYIHVAILLSSSFRYYTSDIGARRYIRAWLTALCWIGLLSSFAAFFCPVLLPYS